MIYNIPIKKLLIFILLFSIQGCSDQSGSIEENEGSSSEVEKEVRKQIKAAYRLYENSDLKWIDFYNDTYTVITDDGSILEKNADSLKKQWKNIYKKYDVIVKYHGEPTVIGSGNQALHYNTASEIFIDKKTKDTLSNNSGTWIALWQQQSDGSWKIILETYKAK